jgi:hypothetical protein
MENKTKTGRLDLKGLVSRITYKPYWIFQINKRLDMHGYPHSLRISATMLDPCTRKMVLIQSTYIVPEEALHDQTMFLEWVRTCIEKREMHETDEWFGLDGVALWHPHNQKN